MKPWLETWEVHPRNGHLVVRVAGFPDDHGVALALDKSHAPRARLAAAAPALVRALLNAEWDGDRFAETPFGDKCPECGGVPREVLPSGRLDPTLRHHPNCDIDAALTAAGLPDQASRDEARRGMR